VTCLTLAPHAEACLTRLCRYGQDTPSQRFSTLLAREEQAVTGQLTGEALSSYYRDEAAS
jgi:hypothetical protein